ncbi:MAG: hypothetical protein ABSB75_03225 [Candidatus Limnocylindrales bacterium]
MENTPTRRQDRRRRRGLLALLIAGAAIISVTGSIISLAVFTDSQQVTGNTFTTGTIDISVVTNAGTAQLRYAITGIATDADGKHLYQVLTITIRTLGTNCATFDGTSLFSGTVGIATTNLVGDPTQGGQVGDRTLNASANETLCFRATLPLGTGNGYQGATTTMIFTFDAEQTANNP